MRMSSFIMTMLKVILLLCCSLGYFTVNGCSSGGGYFAPPPPPRVQCPTIVSRSGWGARPPKSVSLLSSTPLWAFVHHSSSASNCYSQSSCAAQVRSYQNYHMDTEGWDDIGYSFIIGGDGTVFEGRGWDTVGAHTPGYNSNGLGFCLTGNFMNESPTQAQLNSLEQLLKCGVDQSRLRFNYILKGHRDAKATDCPGDNLYNIIRTWPHY